MHEYVPIRLLYFRRRFAMTLQNSELSILIDDYTLAAIIPMKDGAETVSVRVTKEALTRLGFTSGDAKAFCEPKREYFRAIADAKYAGRDVIIYERDIQRDQSLHPRN
jgi:hypothetical protein